MAISSLPNLTAVAVQIAPGPRDVPAPVLIEAAHLAVAHLVEAAVASLEHGLAIAEDVPEVSSRLHCLSLTGIRLLAKEEVFHYLLL